MAKELLYSESGEKVYGWQKDFKNANDFRSAVKDQHDGENIRLVNIKVEACISSNEAIPADTVMPLTNAKIIIENFITGTIEEE